MSKGVLRILVSVGLCLAVTVICLGGCAGGPAQGKTVKVGYTGPLTGPAAMWGIGGLRGLEIWADQVNEEGGLDVGGTTYEVELIALDGKAEPSEVLKLTRKLVLEDEVAVVSNFLFGDVSAPFCNEQEMLAFTIEGHNLHPDWKYTICAGNADPEYMAPTVMFTKAELFPDIESIAICSQDTESGKIWREWYATQAKLMGMDVTYNKAFSEDTLDFAPIVSAMLATSPDSLCWDGSYPDFNALLTEQAYIQGFDEGPILSSSHDKEATLAKVPAEWLARRFISSYPGWDDPALGEEANRVFEEYQSRHGEGAWQCDAGIIYEQARYWQQAVEQAGTLDCTAVRDTLVTSEFHSCWGNGPASTWYGEEIYGIANYILPERWPIAVFHADENRDAVGAWANLVTWWDDYGDGMLEALEAEGLLWWQ